MAAGGGTVFRRHAALLAGSHHQGVDACRAAAGRQSADGYRLVAAVSALFVLPTYPTLLAAVEMDDTGSTRIGKYVFNHAFLIPGVIAITLCVILGFIFGGIML